MKIIEMDFREIEIRVLAQLIKERKMKTIRLYIYTALLVIGIYILSFVLWMVWHLWLHIPYALWKYNVKI